jgi:Putative protein-S-isoprenylcysteine methyltransferase
VPSSGLGRFLGTVTIGAGIGFDICAVVTLRRHRANVLPHRGATALVTSGPFAISRNPIYFGNVMLTIGLAPFTGSLWYLAAAALEWVLVTRLAIRREEAHLAKLFGADFDVYQARTARWIGRRRALPSLAKRRRPRSTGQRDSGH